MAKRRLLVRVYCHAETCGKCEFCCCGECNLFLDSTGRGTPLNGVGPVRLHDHARCYDCLAAERAAKERT